VSKSTSKLSDVAVIVATRNDEETIVSCVDSLLEASQGKAEIILVDDASTDRTPELLRQYAERIQILKGKGGGPGKARNLAMQETERAWIAFTDGDCRVDPKWLSTLAKGLDGTPEKVASIGGPQLVSSQAELTERQIGEFLERVGFVSDYLHGESQMVSVVHNPTCNVLYDRVALESVGGFDETLWPCEDLDLDLRLRKRGYSFLFHPEAKVEHRRPRTWEAFWRMMRRYGFAHAQLVKKQGLCQRLHVLPLMAPFLALAVIGGLVVFPRTSVVVLLGLGGGLLWVFRRRPSSELGPLRLIGILSRVVTEWLIGFYGGLKGRKRVAQQHA